MRTSERPFGSLSRDSRFVPKRDAVGLPAIPAPPIRGREQNGKENGKMIWGYLHHTKPPSWNNNPRATSPVIAAWVRSV